MSLKNFSDAKTGRGSAVTRQYRQHKPQSHFEGRCLVRSGIRSIGVDSRGEDTQHLKINPSVDDLKKFHDKYFGADYATMVIVGDVDWGPAPIQAKVKKSFADWSGGQPLPVPRLPKPLKPSTRPRI